MRIAICDDDELFADRLLKQIEEFFSDLELQLPDIELYKSGDDLLQENNLYDMVFLDIEMQGLNGIQVGQFLKERNKNTIIFVVTSYLEYLDDAMRFNVFRYLSKPIENFRLHRNLKDALSLYSTTIEKITIEHKLEMVTVYLSDIIYIESTGRETMIHTISGDYRSSKNMKNWDDIQNKPGFFKTHRNHIVNMKYVIRFDSINVFLYGEKQAYISRRKYKEFKEKYLFYLESTR